MGEKRKRKRDTARIPREFERLVDLETRTGISGAEFRKLWAEGRGPRRFKVGRMVLVKREDADRWIESHAVATEA